MCGCLIVSILIIYYLCGCCLDGYIGGYDKYGHLSSDEENDRQNTNQRSQPAQIKQEATDFFGLSNANENKDNNAFSFDFGNEATNEK